MIHLLGGTLEYQNRKSTLKILRGLNGGSQSDQGQKNMKPRT